MTAVVTMRSYSRMTGATSLEIERNPPGTSSRVRLCLALVGVVDRGPEKTDSERRGLGPQRRRDVAELSEVQLLDDLAGEERPLVDLPAKPPRNEGRGLA